MRLYYTIRATILAFCFDCLRRLGNQLERVGDLFDRPSYIGFLFERKGYAMSDYFIKKLFTIDAPCDSE